MYAHTQTHTHIKDLCISPSMFVKEWYEVCLDFLGTNPEICQMFHMGLYYAAR